MNLIRRIIRPFFATRRRGYTTVAVLAALGIPLLFIAGWLIRPLFVDTIVDEAFPLSAGASVPEQLTHDEAKVMMSAVAKLEVEVDEPMSTAMEAATPLKVGTFVDGDSFHRGSGSATIYQLADGSYVLRFEDFRVTNGPALYVLLSPHPSPEGSGDATAEGYIELGRLKGNIGPQNYFFPEGAAPDDFNSVVIYCKPFRVVFSVASLSSSAP